MINNVITIKFIIVFLCLILLMMVSGCSDNVTLKTNENLVELQKQLKEATEKNSDLQSKIDDQQEIINDLKAQLNTNQSPAPTVASPTAFEQFLWNCIKQSFDILKGSPDQFPLHDVEINVENKPIYDAIDKYCKDLYDTMDNYAKEENCEIYCVAFKIEDITEEFGKKYGDTEYYKKNAYYFNLYQLGLRLNGDVSSIFEDNPRELIVFQENGKWVALPARG